MKTSTVARRYGKALFVLTKQKGIHDKTLLELRSLEAILAKDPAARDYFANPLIGPDQKLQVVKSAFTVERGLQEETVNLLLLLAERNRFDRLGEIAEAFEELINEDAGVTRGIVRAPRPLSAEAMKELEGKISIALKKKIVLSYREDSKLLGGVVAEVGGWTFDDSLETHLRKMNEELNRSAN